ncbi:MAG: UvrD-helicase domain-containing protein, partial [Lachnospiraceae bacterium]|nr:UvrD-helicase domain-containing protein [Lachnospiraceae bacterium]
MKLNKEQYIAAHHYRGPMLVLAGPGSGKTHLLVER